MIRVTEAEKSRSVFWIPLIVGSFLAHGIFFYVADQWAESKPREHYDPSRIEFTADEPPPPPEPEPEAEPEPEREVAEKKVRPRPNTTKTPLPEPESAKPPRPVFGVTADSVTGSNSGVSVRVGNTLEKEMEREFTRPQKVAQLLPSPPEQPKPKKEVEPVPVFELTKAPSFRKKVEPKYPEEARRKEIEGVVQLEVFIDARGKVRKVRVLKTPGHGLDRAAIAALSKSSFNPGMMGKKAVPVKITIPYRFVLDS